MKMQPCPGNTEAFKTWRVLVRGSVVCDGRRLMAYALVPGSEPDPLAAAETLLAAEFAAGRWVDFDPPHPGETALLRIEPLIPEFGSGLTVC